jgi:hypothetical protein
MECNIPATTAIRSSSYPLNFKSFLLAILAKLSALLAEPSEPSTFGGRDINEIALRVLLYSRP